VAISSRQHPAIQHLRAVATQRGEPGELLLDGEHLLSEALAAGVRVTLVVSDGRADGIVGRARAAGAATHVATPAILQYASPVKTATGLVAVGTRSPVSPRRVFESGSLVVGLVDVQDPGNVGNVIRSAHALGGGGVIAMGATADPFGWKALRGSMGSAFHVPVARAETGETLAAARARGYRVAATIVRGGQPLDAADLTGPMLVLLGNEGAGLAGAAAEEADVHVSIPIAAGIDSLNVSVAAALILWEARRARGAR
jgi:TrmH family RNA methyltransferase